MNPVEPAPIAPRRSHRPWVIAALVLLLAPFVFFAGVAYSMMTLDRDAAALRREVMRATGSDWHTKVQLDVGWATLGAARTILHFVHHEHIDDARLALTAVRHASVGVYERPQAQEDIATPALFEDTDRLMQRRGWTRLVGVAEGRQTVLIYTADSPASGNRVDLCLAVVDGKELVVVSTRVDAEALARLVEKHAPDELRTKLKFANLKL